MNSPATQDPQPASRRTLWILFATLALTLFAFFGLLPKFGHVKVSTVHWLWTTWNDENKFHEHGWIVAVVMAWFIYKAWKPMRAEPVKGSNTGLWWLALGIFFWVGGVRTIQGRAAVLSLPFLVLGCVHYAAGWRVTRHLLFPLSLVAFMIPVPGIEQMTSNLAVISSKIAHRIGMLIGIETIQSGTELRALHADWGKFQVDDGCSGIRSLVALMLISYSYAMVVHRKWMERFIIFAAALPIAIVANGVRITSILIVANVNHTFASETWHNYSGFFSFGAAFGLLMLLSLVMRKGFRALRPKATVTRVGGGGNGNDNNSPES
jgi:exosortase